MKTARVGAGIGAIAGAFQLLCFEILCLTKLEARPSAVGLASAAIPSIGVAAACGCIVALVFRRLRPHALTAAILTIGLYWVLAWLFSVLLATWIRRSPGVINASGLMALPVLMVVLWLVGVVLMIPAALIIRRAVRAAAAAA